jgi:hypothetical protein
MSNHHEQLYVLYILMRFQHFPLVRNTTGASTEQPIVCLVHHLSPLGRLLSRSAFNFSIQNSPRAKLGVSLKDRRDLLKIEIGMTFFQCCFHILFLRRGTFCLVQINAACTFLSVVNGAT